MTWPSKIYIGSVVAVGGALIAAFLPQLDPADPLRFVCYGMIPILRYLNLKAPENAAPMSVSLFFILLAIQELSVPESLMVGCAGAAIHCVWTRERTARLIRMVFDVAVVAIAVVCAERVYDAVSWYIRGIRPVFLLMITATTYFALSSLLVSGGIAAMERKALLGAWRDRYWRLVPHCLLAAATAWAVGVCNLTIHWQASLVALAAVYFLYRTYRLYRERLENQREHLEDMAALQRRTIEALAMAIEARDFTAEDHLQRVWVYALEIGKALELRQAELDVLRTVALSHDIGMLAIPQHVISKPGRLTPEEYEKIKTHTIVGAGILERAQFPYPVSPIVRAHHENWDGSGYPDGLKGEGIPIGARILAVVDCFDALMSDRPYRRALPRDRAVAMIQAEAGRMFDPAVVRVLTENQARLEVLARTQAQHECRLSTGVRVIRGSAPAAGFADGEPIGFAQSMSALSSIAEARDESQMLLELAGDLGNSLSLDETLSVLATRLKRMVPYDALAIYLRRDNLLAPTCVTGEDYGFFSSLEIPLGEGVSGWVAANRKPLLNADPRAEASQGSPPAGTKLKSALSVPLNGLNGVVGVLAVYRAEQDAFTKDHLRILLAIGSKASPAIENAVKYRQAENLATIDYLTNLPNARSLFLRLDSELARCKREETGLAVLVGDLNGFKQLNDTKGHLEGNRILRAIADGLQNSCRTYDYVARMGGDEFVLLFPGLTHDALEGMIARLGSIVTDATREAGYEGLSMSIGASAYPDDGADAEQLLAHADRRMYKAKQARDLRTALPMAIDDLVWQPLIQ